jgi:predicted nucleic acid-binding protein
MTRLCFVDANVLVYVRDARNAAKQSRAAAWHEYLWRERLGRTSMQVLSEYYATMKRLARGILRPAELWDSVARYFEWAPQPIDEPLLRRAREIEERYRLSWWDSMIVSAAQLQGCALLLTEDLHDGAAFGTVIVRSPFTLEVSEPVAQYAVKPLTAGLHRPRGRPKRAAAPGA